MRRFDALLVLMVLIWGVNYSVLKRAFPEIPPQPFNALRLVLASRVFLMAIRVTRGGGGRCRPSIFTPQCAHDALIAGSCCGSGFVGHFGYQFCFVGGVATTSVSNGALIIGTTPVVVALVSALMGRERIGRCTGLVPRFP